MTTSLTSLADLLYDVGYWRWWDADLPRVVQLEFGGVQLAADTPAGPRPVDALALRFYAPTAAVFLTRDSAELPSDWPARLHADEQEPFGLSYEQLTFDDARLAAEYLAVPAEDFALIGARPSLSEWEAAAAKLVFWAGPVGAVVTAERMELVTHDGPLTLEAIPGMKRLWWTYWREYWRRRGTDDALPHDWACEVTIPMGDPTAPQLPRAT